MISGSMLRQTSRRRYRCSYGELPSLHRLLVYKNLADSAVAIIVVFVLILLYLVSGMSVTTLC